MVPGSGSRAISRRGMLRAAALLAGASALPLLQACAAPAAPTPVATTPQVVEKAVTQVVEKQVTQVVEKQATVLVTQVVQQQVVVTAPPKPSAPINGNVSVIQEPSCNPRMTE